MFRVLDASGELIAACEHAEIATRLCRTIARADRVETDEGVVIAWRPARDLTLLAYAGREAGSPREWS